MTDTLTRKPANRLADGSERPTLERTGLNRRYVVRAQFYETNQRLILTVEQLAYLKGLIADELGTDTPSLMAYGLV